MLSEAESKRPRGLIVNISNMVSAKRKDQMNAPMKFKRPNAVLNEVEEPIKLKKPNEVEDPMNLKRPNEV